MRRSSGEVTNVLRCACDDSDICDRFNVDTVELETFKLALDGAEMAAAAPAAWVCASGTSNRVGLAWAAMLTRGCRFTNGGLILWPTCEAGFVACACALPVKAGGFGALFCNVETERGRNVGGGGSFDGAAADEDTAALDAEAKIDEDEAPVDTADEAAADEDASDEDAGDEEVAGCFGRAGGRKRLARLKKSVG